MIFEDVDENKLEYSPVYEHFCETFNKRVESFLKRRGYSLKQFMRACEEAEEDNFLIQMILCITSFEAFKAMMLETKAKLMEERAKNGGHAEHSHKHSSRRHSRSNRSRSRTPSDQQRYHQRSRSNSRSLSPRRPQQQEEFEI